MSTLEDALQLLGRVRSFDESQVVAQLCAELMTEFIRREAAWAMKLGKVGEIPFAYLAPTTFDDYDSRVMPYRDLLRAYVASTTESRACLAMLEWYRWEQRPSVVDLPDPYEPLLHLLSIGGWFDGEHRIFIDVNHRRFADASVVWRSVLDQTDLRPLQ